LKSRCAHDHLELVVVSLIESNKISQYAGLTLTTDPKISQYAGLTLTTIHLARSERSQAIELLERISAYCLLQTIVADLRN